MNIRNAAPDDAGQLADLIEGLDHHLTPEQLRANLERLEADGLPQLVAEEDGRIVGLLGMDRMEPLYRPKPVARMTILIVADSERGRGIGRQLVNHAVAIAKGWGCGMIEVTSNDRLEAAHDFYRALGWKKTSKRFALMLD